MSDTVIRASAETVTLGIPGRALCSVRGNHFVTDDPDHPLYGGPGEEPSSIELFVSGITSCAVLLVERVARAKDIALPYVHAAMSVVRDTAAASDGPPVLQSAHLTFTFRGVTREQAGLLVEAFKGR